jgi:nucleotide-binding universal stress UspA family protein
MSARPIVVGTDGSEESLRAVDWATGEAARRGAPLRIVTVTAPSPRPRPRFRPRSSTESAGDDVQRSAYAETLTVTAGHAAGVAPGLAIETELLSGAPARMLIGDASAASMLVVAACGIGGYGETSAGPVSRYVAARAACPVVVFRDQGPSVHGEVVVGVHDPDEAGDVLQFAFEEAAMRGARLLAVQAWHWIPPAGRPAPVPQEAWGPRRAAAVLTAPRHLPGTRGQSAQAAARLAEVLRAWQQKYPRVPASPKVIHGHPGRVLASFSGMADLTVIGRHHEHASLHPSPVLQSLLNHAQGSVAVIPAA